VKAPITLGVAGLLYVGALLPVGLHAQTSEPYSPGVRYHTNPHKLLWGDTHLHSNMSADAFMQANESLTPEDAYRFARGEVITSNAGVQAALKTPLDFLVVADHAEFIGVFPGVATNDATVVTDPLGRRWRDYYEAGDLASMFKEFQAVVMGDAEDETTPALRQTIWQSVAEAADRFNDPAHFTALIGYEWSSSPNANNLHRVVVYEGGAEAATILPPFSAIDSEDPEALWAFLARYEALSGSGILAIPHNGNLSNGLIFGPKTFSGEPISREYAETRARWEPIYEVTQIKGDGEAHPTLSPNDPFADYETWDTGNFPVRDQERAKTADMLPYEYARSALQLGLGFEQSVGANPFQFGMIGSSDAHTTLAAVEEDNFFGKFRESEPTAKRLTSNMEWLGWPNQMIASSGLAAVWARENTREEIFAAMKRREVYATTGSRIALRVFGGWQFSPDDITNPQYADVGYAHGVPMGGELATAPRGKAPGFLIAAAKDPIEANLDRVQVVKGWVTADGTLHEKIFDVAASDNRKPDPQTGLVPNLASTVDVTDAQYRNTIGAAEIMTFWEDPEFDPAVPAVYYVRVLEIPKPRWTAYDAKHFGLTPRADAQLVTQDRAYSSPIWYTP
jgi:hypothetical protein